ncbi:ABC transporter transmembrane domain-containing protein [Pseudodonghicola flavimaris]|uniref:ABC transporter transmembrane domain-containing protein n=1 Tax=Pseudodonghicola flavimaris TaxID=3050036 RepID=A0ABT7EZ74_9RHOB|nr:ABC transporter transmembrane domain-containing protein [Pseudodonghicola flavimaris]MDK3017656.1 ABC transporter transmembrane domain-containing protein [Pseudodonghicola flavimaris]
MEPNLFSFIWKYSKRQQLWLLVLTLISFPFLYASLELPKRIINDAIGAQTSQIDVYGMTLSQVQFLLLLCFGFMATVLVGGLMKMYINTRKGVLSERMLRRLRYQLISRMLRFPKPYFRTTSQGELVSMITSEAEPMGGLMGDAVAQPVFQFGQMMTIIFFLFMQSVWFGLASIALIPLQAWLIPMLQRQINLLNKERIVEVRHLSTEIGETAAGITDLRANGGWRYRLAQFTDRLGRLFEIRFRIYQKKYFMKFLNNMIGHLTPFMYYSAGGYLAIHGQITVGALVAALSAYKDLSSPWKELLTYYNQVQDMSLRWEVVTSRFAPRNMIPEELFEGEPSSIPHLYGTIELRDVSVRDQDGNIVLEDINLKIPPRARVAIQCTKPAERTALAELLLRETLPSKGEVIISGRRIETLHQAVIAARIGYANSRPYLFDGTLGDNLLMPLKMHPHISPHMPRDRAIAEAVRAGNSPDPLTADWVDPGIAGLSDAAEVRDWWFDLIEAMGIDESMFRRTLRSTFDPALHPTLAHDIAALRPEIRKRLEERGLDDIVFHFDPDRFNPAVPLAGNLFYATPIREFTADALAHDDRFLKILDDQGLAEEAIAVSIGVIDTLNRTFGRDGTHHPLFQRLGLDEDLYQRITDIAARRSRPGRRQRLSPQDRAMLLIVPFMLTAEQIGPNFPEEYKEKILAIRRSKGEELRRKLSDLFLPVDPDRYVPRLTVVENAIFGRVSMIAGVRSDEVEDVVAEVLSEHGLRRRITAIIYDLRAGLGGTNLAPIFQERAAFTRAGLKRPDILIMDKVLSSHNSASRLRTRQRLRELLPNSIMLFMENRFENPDAYDMFVEIRNGRINTSGQPAMSVAASGASDDLSRKVALLSANDLLGRLSLRNRRLLAFSAQWYQAAPGHVVFSHSQTADAVYLCLEGHAELRWPGAGNTKIAPVSSVRPGRLIGDLAVITRDKRFLDLVAVEPTRFLRIGAEEFRAVIENDASVALALLEEVATHLTGATELLQAAQINLSDYATPPGTPRTSTADPLTPEKLNDYFDD